MKKEHEPILTKPYLGRTYDSIEFTVSNGLTNYDVDANESAAFSNLLIYTTINIRSDQNITIRFNSTSNPAITVNAGRPYELDDLLEITNIYITNASGNTANLKIFGARKGA